MSGATGIIVGVVLGSIFLLSIGGGFFYYRHRRTVKDTQSVELAVEQVVEQAVEEHLQHVVDLNLPPFYADHELDPVCVYEHELPPGVIPPEQPILVDSPPDIYHIPPEDDPLVVSPPPLQRNNSSFPFNSTPQPSGDYSGDSGSITSPDVTFSAVVSTPQTEQASSGLQTPSIRSSDLQNSSYPSAIASSSSSVTSLPHSIAASPRFVDQTMLRLARLQSPPSYDVPNRVVDRSPLGHPHHQQYRNSHHHSHSASDIQQFLVSPSISNLRGQEDYFSHRGRMRSHTFSHSAPNPEQLQQPRAVEEEQLPATPRYSLEFPSTVPHQQYLEEHQRARAASLSNTAANSFGPTSIEGEGERQTLYSIPMQDRSPSQMSSSSDRQRKPVGRSRASTIGESSRLLVQRVHSLLGRTPPGTPNTCTAGQSSASTGVVVETDLDTVDRVEHGVIGLGLSQLEPGQGQDQDVEQRSSSDIVDGTQQVAEISGTTDQVDDVREDVISGVLSSPAGLSQVSVATSDSFTSTGIEIEIDSNPSLREHGQVPSHLSSGDTIVSMPVGAVCIPVAVS